MPAGSVRPSSRRPPHPAVDPGSVQVTIIREQGDLDALEDEWNSLYDRSPTATPFQCHAWVAAWSRAYCPPGRLRVVVARRSGRLAAAIPFHLERRGPWGVLSPVGGSANDHTDLLAPHLDDAVGEALADALVAEPGWRMIDWPEVRPDAAVHRWITAWPGRVTRLRSSTCLELPVEEVPQLMSRMPGRTANTMRRKLRKVEAVGIDIEEVPAARVPAAIERMLELHADQWRGRRVNAEHLTARFRRHLDGALSVMVADGRAVVVEFRICGDVVLSQILLAGPRTLSYYLAGIAPSLRELVDTSALLVSHDMETALERGLSRYSMLRGEEHYKYRWRPEAVSQDRLLLSRPGLRGAVGLPFVIHGRAAAIRSVKHRAPWLRSLLRR